MNRNTVFGSHEVTPAEKVREMDIVSHRFTRILELSDGTVGTLKRYLDILVDAAGFRGRMD